MEIEFYRISGLYPFRANGRRIMVGSASKIKIDAVKEALISLQVEGGQCALITLESDMITSTVDPQPVGLEEGLRGAIHRAVSTRKRNPYALAVGIENFIERESPGHGWSDRAAICCLGPGCLLETVITKSISIPDSLAESVIRGAQQVTIGQKLHLDYPSVNAEDPHSFLTEGRWSRSEILVMALIPVLGRMLDAMS